MTVDAGDAPATRLFSEALRELLRAGRRPPCCASTPDAATPWTSDDHRQRARAVDACQPCPILDACRAMASEAVTIAGTYRHRVSFGVFGGVDFTRTSSARRRPGMGPARFEHDTHQP